MKHYTPRLISGTSRESLRLPIRHVSLLARFALLLCYVSLFPSGRTASAQQLDASFATLSSSAPMPPMGWAGWNRFFCDYNEATIREQSDALVSTGMRELGYRYVLIQECIAPGRQSDGTLLVDPVRFPQGMKPLIDYIHSRGLKAGVYTDVGVHTCFGPPYYQGSFGHEDADAATFAAWGFDLIEMDYCDRQSGVTGREVYERMAQSIRKTGRPMLFYICTWGNERPWEWAQGTAGLWRTDQDISWEKNHAEWSRVLINFESNARHAVFSAPNSWNDPDMLEVGNEGLTPDEVRSHFSMWAISAAPLWASTDLAHMNDATRAVLTNAEVIRVDQDPLGAQATKVQEDERGLEIWAKPLGSKSSGLEAVLLLNLQDHPAAISVRWIVFLYYRMRKYAICGRTKTLATFATATRPQFLLMARSFSRSRDISPGLREQTMKRNGRAIPGRGTRNCWNVVPAARAMLSGCFPPVPPQPPASTFTASRFPNGGSIVSPSII